jgi:flagellar basal-body rod protein FlgF
MGSGIYIASAGAVAQSDALDVTANNIANAGTTGFRADRVSFGAALARVRSPDIALVGVAATEPDISAGALEQTMNPLDLALEGDGFFAVDTAKGTRYTRAGNFRLDDERKLVTAEGNPVRGDGGPISIPEGTRTIAISADGEVTADDTVVGKLELTRFKANQVKREGGTLFSASGKPEDGEPP